MLKILTALKVGHNAYKKQLDSDKTKESKTITIKFKIGKMLDE